MLRHVLIVSGWIALGCGGKSGATFDPAEVDGSIGAPGDVPRLGAHALAFHGLWAHDPVLTTVPMGTSAAGSTIIASVGRGDLGAFVLPTDNKGNAPFTQLGTAH